MVVVDGEAHERTGSGRRQTTCDGAHAHGGDQAPLFLGCKGSIIMESGPEGEVCYGEKMNEVQGQKELTVEDE